MLRSTYVYRLLLKERLAKVTVIEGAPTFGFMKQSGVGLSIRHAKSTTEYSTNINGKENQALHHFLHHHRMFFTIVETRLDTPRSLNIIRPRTYPTNALAFSIGNPQSTSEVGGGKNEAVSAVSLSLGYVERLKPSGAAVSMPRNALILISRWNFCYVVRLILIADSYWTATAAR